MQISVYKWKFIIFLQHLVRLMLSCIEIAIFFLANSRAIVLWVDMQDSSNHKPFAFRWLDYVLLSTVYANEVVILLSGLNFFFTFGIHAVIKEITVKI